MNKTAELIEKIERYCPRNAQEEQDKRVIIQFIKNNPDAFLRSNPIAHMTASSWVTNAQHSKVLMIYHSIYNSWSWTGGHADGEEDLLSVAIKELKEETGVKTVTPLSDEIFSLEVLTVDGHEKHGSYVPSHLHMNITFLLMADEAETLTVCEGENSAVSWFELDEALRRSSEPWFVQRIYKKLNRALCDMDECGKGLD